MNRRITGLTLPLAFVFTLGSEGCFDSTSEVTYIGVSARLDNLLDAECVAKAIRSTIGAKAHVNVMRSPYSPYPMFDFSSDEEPKEVIFYGVIFHDREIIRDRNNDYVKGDPKTAGEIEPFRFDVFIQGTFISDAWVRKTYPGLARVAKHVTEVCGRASTRGRGCNHNVCQTVTFAQKFWETRRLTSLNGHNIRNIWFWNSRKDTS